MLRRPPAGPDTHAASTQQVWNVQSSGARGAIVVNFEVGQGV